MRRTLVVEALTLSDADCSTVGELTPASTPDAQQQSVRERARRFSNVLSLDLGLPLSSSASFSSQRSWSTLSDVRRSSGETHGTAHASNLGDTPQPEEELLCPGPPSPTVRPGSPGLVTPKRLEDPERGFGTALGIRSTLYRPLPGEQVRYSIPAMLLLDVGKWHPMALVVTNFRCIFKSNYHPLIRLPVMAIESIVVRPEEEGHYLGWRLQLKEFAEFSLRFSTAAAATVCGCAQWLQDCHQMEAAHPPFCFAYAQHCRTPQAFRFDLQVELDRMVCRNPNLAGRFRVSTVNTDFQACPSYGPHVICPAGATDADLCRAALYRSHRRFPIVSYIHPNGVVLARSAQPKRGMCNATCPDDELLVQLLLPHGPSAAQPVPGQSAGVGWVQRTLDFLAEGEAGVPLPDPPAGWDAAGCLYIVDARSFAAAVGQMTTGGGIHCIPKYRNSRQCYMAIGNIHTMRESQRRLKQALGARLTPGGSNWLLQLEDSGWLAHLASILRAAVHMAQIIESGASVLCHCSDGWDRTTQLVSLVQLLLDPYYRTLEGFMVLVEKEWVQCGHRFAARAGTSAVVGGCKPPSNDVNFLAFPQQSPPPPTAPTSTIPQPPITEVDIFGDTAWVTAAPGSTEVRSHDRCCVFLQWMDCVYQVWRQFPTAFEFSERLLVFLVDHVYSGRFGTFVCNAERERAQSDLHARTVSVWDHILERRAQGRWTNPLYDPFPSPLIPHAHPYRLQLWEAYYLRYDHIWCQPRWCAVGHRIPASAASRLHELGQALATHQQREGMADRNAIDAPWLGPEQPSPTAQDIARSIVEDVVELATGLAEESAQLAEGAAAMFAPLSSAQPFTRRPSWVPDAWADVCSGCSRAFTLLRRRHHCRSCGGLFCDSCSAARVAIPALAYHTPVRICSSCHARLARAPG
eukprot:GGOE01022910.1.p1 GENE.GGOE01022910.1~~GGOE01022910.1.p1  ORF type:complete len:916 (-),score=200.03 GGOE01022910.1:1367-4114(-)